MNHSTAISIFSIRRIIMLCFLIIPLSANASIYMFIEGVPGDAIDANHKDWIDVLTVQESMTQTFDLSPERSTGVVNILDTAINKELDRTSPVLRQVLTSGTPIREVIIAVTTSIGGIRVEYFRLTYSDVLLTSISMQGSGVDGLVPSEDVSLTFSRVEWKYTPIDTKTGVPGSPITTGWDVVNNRPL